MDFHEAINGLTCRLCLCKCETARNLLEEIELADKIMQIFPKVEISPKNSFPTLICDYCHNLVQQFHGYFETVNANQDELTKILIEIPREEIFAEPILNFAEKIDIEEPKMDFDVDDNSIDVAESPPITPSVTPNPNQTDFTQEELLQMDYFQLQKLPLNFSYFLPCPLCSPVQRFKSYSILKTHICRQHYGHLKPAKRPRAAERHLGNLKAFCDICERRLCNNMYSSQFQDHKFVHYDIQPYKCDLCDFTTTSKENIFSHLKTHLRKIEQLGCFICPQNFDTTDLRNDHLRKCHPGVFKQHKGNNFVIECQRCPGGIRFPNEKVLALHQQQHLKGDKTKLKLVCHLCERKFNFESVFSTHLKLHIENRLKACEICGKTISLRGNEEENWHHLNDHLKEKPKSFKCDKCDAEFPSKNMVGAHCRFSHSQKETCHKCGKLRDSGFMAKHLKSCIGGDFKCTHCPMVFKTKSACSRHSRDAHIGHKCTRCDIRFQNESELRFHSKHDLKHKNTKNKRLKLQNNETEIKQ